MSVRATERRETRESSGVVTERRVGARALGMLLVLPLLGGCGDESPTEAGGPLLPGEIRSFEVILEPGRYLIGDTAFSGYGEPFDVPYFIIANDFDGALDAHLLARFELPRTIAVVDTAGVVRADSAPIYFRGEVLVLVDSIRSSTKGPVTLELLPIAEPWDGGTATWTLRIDSTGVRLPWAQPGGTVGARIDTATWSAAGGDTLRLAVDSATLAAWRDTLDFSRGALIRVVDGDMRMRTSGVLLRAEARSTHQPDTVVTSTIQAPDPTFIFDPPIATISSAPRVGGITAWRTFLLLRQRLDTLRLPCPDQPDCTLPLRDATINYAALLLEPVAPPAGFVPEDSLRLVVRGLVEAADVPLIRSLLGGIAGQMLEPLPAARFAGGGEPIELPITEYLRAASADTVTEAAFPQRIALIPAVQSATFGFAAFQALPRLRLVVSVASELQLR